MSAPTTTAVKNTVIARNPLPPKFIIPALVIALIVGYFMLSKTRGPSEEDIAAESARVATQEQLRNLTAAGVIVTPTQPPAANPQPDYDFLTCTHTAPGDPECVPFAPDPLTVEAKELIGWQGGIRDGALNRDTTRDIVNQIRNMAGVRTCDMYLGMVPRENKSLDRTVYPNQAAAPPGAVKLYDCSPIAGPAISVPTAGQS